MLANALNRRIKQHDWWIEEAPCTHQAAEWAWHGFIESARHFDNRFLTLGLFFYSKDFVTEATPRKEKIEQFLFALGRYRKNRQYIIRRRKRFVQLQRRMLRNGWPLLVRMAGLPRHQLAAAYRNFVSDYRTVAGYSAFIECADPYTEDVLPGKAEQLLPRYSTPVRQRIIATLAVSGSLSFLEKERISFLQSCLAVRAGGNSNEQAKRLSRRYRWIRTHYAQATPKTTSDYQRELQQAVRHASTAALHRELRGLLNKSARLRQERRRVIRKYRVPQELRTICSMLALFSAWVDTRKEGALQATYITYRLLEHLAPILRRPIFSLAYATYDELAAWIASDAYALSDSTLRQRRKFSIYVTEPAKPGYSKGTFIAGKPARQLHAALLKTLRGRKIQGTVAYAGKSALTGNVSRVMHSSADPFQPGTILVTSMTRPDFLPLMRKAKAIVTDEGGLTCHAAIIARELRIPCIIGTRVATRLLRSGDRVRMDLRSGIVERQ